MNNQFRLRTITAAICLVYCLAIGRLFYWQIIKYDEIGKKTINQNYRTSIVYPQKGEIYDINENPLVINQTLFTLSIYKPDLKISQNELLKKIILTHPEEETTLNNFFFNNNQKWIILKSKFTKSDKDKISDPGLKFEPVTNRVYPEGELASLILKNSGIEKYYQKLLEGRPGYNWETKDATGKTILTKSSLSIPPIDGRDIFTSINRKIQFISDSKIKQGVTKFSADSGSITIMDPKTGSIMAMSHFSTATASADRNPIISDLFEPGSIFKPLVMAMALDTNSINENFICTKCDQPLQIGKYSISNWDNSFHPNSNLFEIIKNSDNIGMSYIIKELGLKNFLKYFELLGLDRNTGIDLYGEAKPLNKNYWPEIDLATASFGQGFASTQIQFLTAFNTLANDGIKTIPHVTQYFRENQKVIPNVYPAPTVIYKPNTIKKIKEILKYSVENGVVAKLKPNQIEVCAKSGTSQIAIEGGYSDSSTIASYIGFSPCINPKFTMIVTINNPRTSPWGSSTAAPIWYEIAAELDSLL